MALAWQLGRGVPVIPKSVIPKELEDNLGCFDVNLTEEDIKKVESLERGVRKIVPLKTMKNGKVVPRDEGSKGFAFDEPETEDLLKDD